MSYPELETLVVQFRTELHRAYHKVLLEFGFSFMVGCDMIIGDYEHPKKKFRVELSDGDDGDVDYRIRNEEGEGFTDKDFSEAENQWIHRAKSGTEGMTRELYILLKIRPKSLNSMPSANRIKRLTSL